VQQAESFFNVGFFDFQFAGQVAAYAYAVVMARVRYKKDLKTVVRHLHVAFINYHKNGISIL
jgi:hypothetical protein